MDADPPIRRSYHRHMEANLTESVVFTHHPIDSLEPLTLPSDAIQNARLRFLEIITDWSRTVLNAFDSDEVTIQTVVPAIYGPMFAIGVPGLGVSMTDVANKFGVTRAAISKAAIEFAERHALPPSRYLKSAESRETYSQARRLSIQRNGNGNGSHPPDNGRSV